MRITKTELFRTWLPGILLCGSIALAALFSGDGVASFFGPSAADNTRKMDSFRASRTLLTLQLSKCQRYKTKTNDAYICGGSSLIYKSLASSTDCRLAEQVAQELGITPRDFSIPVTGISGT